MRYVLGLVVGLGLFGCAGISQKLMELSGSEIHMGADAKHPADFPLPPPDGGTITTTASVKIGGVDTTTVIYEISGDTAPLLDKYEQVMKDGGLTVARSTEGGSESVTGTTTDGVAWSAVIGAAGDKKTLTLAVVKLPVEAPAPAPAAP